MAKQKVDMSKLALQAKKPLAQPEEDNTVDVIEAAVEQIHKEEEPEEKATPKKQKRARKQEPVKRITFDLPASLHKKIKIHCVREGVPLKEFLLDCVVREINKT